MKQKLLIIGLAIISLMSCKSITKETKRQLSESKKQLQDNVCTLAFAANFLSPKDVYVEKELGYISDLNMLNHWYSRYEQDDYYMVDDIKGDDGYKGFKGLKSLEKQLEPLNNEKFLKSLDESDDLSKEIKNFQKDISLMKHSLIEKTFDELKYESPVIQNFKGRSDYLKKRFFIRMSVLSDKIKDIERSVIEKVKGYTEEDRLEVRNATKSFLQEMMSEEYPNINKESRDSVVSWTMQLADGEFQID